MVTTLRVCALPVMLRRVRSALLIVADRFRGWRVRIFAHYFQDGIKIASSVCFGSQVVISATDCGAICINPGTGIGRYSRLVARTGQINIADDVFIGDGCIVVSRSSISIGAGTQIAEYVVIRDQDHDVQCRPFAQQLFESTPIVIGPDCWIGAKSTILRGSHVGEGAVIGAHSVVRGEIPPYCLAVGAPARVVKVLRRPAPPARRVDMADKLPPEATV